MAHSIVDINTLDQLLRDELDKLESATHFSLALWRKPPNGNGANWDAKVRRIQGNAANTAWWDVVPRLRRIYALRDEEP